MNRYIVEARDGTGFLLECEEDIVAKDIALSSLVKQTVSSIMKPYPNEHACRQANPGQFTDFRRGESKIDGKPVGVIYGTDTDGHWHLQSYRFPTKDWTETEARSACSGEFEPASEKETKEEKRIIRIVKGAETVTQVRIAKAEKKQQLVYGVALEPRMLDTYGDWEEEHEIEMTAHRFLLKSQFLDEDAIGASHDYPIAAAPVESYIAPVDFWFEGTPHTDEYLVRKGSWVLVAKIYDPEEFQKIEDGTYTGWSIQGTGYRRTNDVVEEGDAER